MPEKRTALTGYIAVVIAALLWAMSGTAAKLLFQGNITPFQLVQLRTTIAGVLLFAWLFIVKRHLLKIELRDIPFLVLLGIILAAVQFTYLYTISRIPVAAAILIQYQSPVLIALHASIFRKMRLSAPALLAIAGAIIGCYLMVGAYNLALFDLNKIGIISGLASAIAFAWYAIRSEEGMKKYSAWTLLSYALLVAAFVWNILQPPFAAFQVAYNGFSWGLIIYIAVLGTILPFGLYSVGIRAIQATRASVTATLEPVFAGVISCALLNEVLEPWQLAGAGLVMASILLLQATMSGKMPKI